MGTSLGDRAAKARNVARARRFIIIAIRAPPPGPPPDHRAISVSARVVRGARARDRQGRRGRYGRARVKLLRMLELMNALERLNKSVVIGL